MMYSPCWERTKPLSAIDVLVGGASKTGTMELIVLSIHNKVIPSFGVLESSNPILMLLDCC